MKSIIVCIRRAACVYNMTRHFRHAQTGADLFVFALAHKRLSTIFLHFLDALTRMIFSMDKHLDRIDKKLDELTRKLDRVISSNDTPNAIFKLCETLEDVENFQKIIQESDEFRADVVSQLTLVGGKDLTQNVRRVISRMLSSQMQCLFNRTGRSKRCFIVFEKIIKGQQISTCKVAYIYTHFLKYFGCNKSSEP